MSWLDQFVGSLVSFNIVRDQVVRLNGVRRSSASGNWVLLVQNQTCITCDGNGPCPFLIERDERLRGVKYEE